MKHPTPKQIRAAINKSGMTLPKVAEHLGYSLASVEKWLNGTRPMRMKLFEILVKETSK